MQELLLVRYGEIFLKGFNRPYFIRALVRKVRYAVRGLGAEVWVHDGRIFVKDFKDLDECIARVTKVFGVHSVCPAVEMPKDDFEAICKSLGKKAHIWKLPKGLMIGVAKIGGVLHLPLNPERLRKLTESYVSSNAKIKKALGVEKMPVDAREGLKVTLEIFK